MQSLKQAFVNYEDRKSEFEGMLVNMDEGQEVSLDKQDRIEDAMADAELELLNTATEHFKTKAEMVGNTEFTDRTIHDAFTVNPDRVVFLIEQEIK